MGTEPRYLGCTHLEVKQLGWPHHTLCAESRSAAFAFNFSAFKKNFYGCFCICTYVCTPLGAWFPWKPEWVLEWLKPLLQTVMRHHVGAGNQPGIFWESIQAVVLCDLRPSLASRRSICTHAAYVHTQKKCFLKNVSGGMVGSVWQTVWDFSGMKWSSWGTKCKETLLAYMH